MLVIAQHATMVIGSDWLRHARDLIGSTLDLSRTAGEVVSVSVHAFADAASLFVAERLLAADEAGRHQAGRPPWCAASWLAWSASPG